MLDFDAWAVLNNIAETSVNEKRLKKENEKTCERTNCYDRHFKRKFPFKKLRTLIVNSQYLKWKKHGPEDYAPCCVIMNVLLYFDKIGGVFNK